MDGWMDGYVILGCGLCRDIHMCTNRCFTDTGPEDYKDAPTAVQLVGYRYEDEKLMQIAGLVDEMVHGVPA